MNQQARVVIAAQDLVDQFGGDVPDWLQASYDRLAAALEECGRLCECCGEPAGEGGALCPACQESR